MVTPPKAEANKPNVIFDFHWICGSDTVKGLYIKEKHSFLNCTLFSFKDLCFKTAIVENK